MTTTKEGTTMQTITLVTIDPLPDYYTAVIDRSNTWNGFVIPRINRREAERLAANQAIVCDTYPESDRLAFDGDTLVRTNPDPDAVGWEDRVDPDEDGLYAVGFGWTWSEFGYSPDDDSPTAIPENWHCPQCGFATGHPEMIFMETRECPRCLYALPQG